jgi:hypothetical protein
MLEPSSHHSCSILSRRRSRARASTEYPSRSWPSPSDLQLTSISPHSDCRQNRRHPRPNTWCRHLSSIAWQNPAQPCGVIISHDLKYHVERSPDSLVLSRTTCLVRPTSDRHCLRYRSRRRPRSSPLATGYHSTTPSPQLTKNFYLRLPAAESAAPNRKLQEFTE